MIDSLRSLQVFIPSTAISGYVYNHTVKSNFLSILFSYLLENIVISGMGGSAAGGGILISYLRENLKIPAIVNRSYSLPLFVNEKTLAIVISYSGNTDETLSSLKYANEKGSKIITITSGGVIEEFCSRN